MNVGFVWFWNNLYFANIVIQDGVQDSSELLDLRIEYGWDSVEERSGHIEFKRRTKQGYWRLLVGIFIIAMLVDSVRSYFNNVIAPRALRHCWVLPSIYFIG